ncbi:sulfatase-like hydrolase/transferase [candidate division KSB1 bacterium]|nr:sulfatase-like hydrolase/transferase [candidate division KSB1 bacterium]
MSSTKFTRRDFLKSAGVSSTLLFLPGIFNSCQKKAEQPNILWITSEDNSPFLGCYGDTFATTPNLDKLASEGVLYENAYANAPVCAPARNCIITGMYPPSMGTQHMRSLNSIPETIKFFPQYLREAGYYCTNNSKEDYNTLKPDGVWDESSEDATYTNRAPGQPFFAVFNIMTSHESSIHKTEENLRHDPAKVRLPAYHPDTPETRHDWAQYYDKVEDMDKQVGEFLAKLEADGLANDTIVFYYADHGGILCRSKRFCYDSGLHVPFLIRFPEKYRHLAPIQPGGRTDRIIAFVDLAPTILSLANIPIPPHMQGRAFLGAQNAEPTDYAYSFRGRMDERYDMMRTVRDKEFRYIRNYMPHRIYGQHLSYLWLAPLTQSWENEYRKGNCNEIQSIFWRPKPPEELYDLKNDPDEVHNLANDPKYQDRLLELRNACLEWQKQIHDTGFIPEGEMTKITKEETLYDFVRSDKYNLNRIIETADMATARNAIFLPELVKRLSDEDKFVRYWAATGCLVLGAKAKSAIPDMKNLLHDASPDVKIIAAEALCNLGEARTALPVIINELKNKNVWVALHATNTLDCIGETAKPAVKALQAASESDDKYIARAAKYTLSQLSE